MSALQRLLFSASAIGEIAVGAAVLVVPELLGLLLDAQLDAYGLLVAQLLGGAVLALGVTWWMARSGPEQALSRCVAGYIVFNLAMGLLFALQALEATRPAVLPWIVGVVHLVMGLGLIVTLLLPPDWRDPATHAGGSARGEGPAD